VTFTLLALSDILNVPCPNQELLRNMVLERFPEPDRSRIVSKMEHVKPELAEVVAYVSGVSNTRRANVSG